MKPLILSAMTAATVILPAGAFAMPEVSDLRTEALETPLGLDIEKPRFYWKLNDPRRGARQTAYQILVATSPDLLAQDKGDVWDSGRIESDQSVHVPYGGPALRPRTRYHWLVRVWDHEGKQVSTPRPTWWETGIMGKANWNAQWIGAPHDQAQTRISTAGIKWIWYPEGDPIKSAPEGIRFFRTTFEIPDGKTIQDAGLYGLADNSFTAYLNGSPAAGGGGWGVLSEVKVQDHLHPGMNTLAVSAGNSSKGPAGLALLLRIRYTDGTEQRITSGEGWKTSTDEQEHWTTTTALGDQWKDARVLGDIGIAPWGTPQATAQGGPASYLRKKFALNKSIKSARAYVTALGSYRLFVNGQRVGNDVLTPDWTEYRKRVSYQTYDVTPLLRQGDNAVGVLLGDGWYASGLGWELKRFCFGEPPLRLLMEMSITYEDGTSETVVTDGSWKWSASPVLRSELYAGETYDARLEQKGWNTAGFDDNGWEPVVLAPAPANVEITGQRSAPVRVTQTLKPVSISSPAPGVHVFDMGQNMVGWVTLKARGPAGTRVRLRFAEILKPDGHIYRDNLRRAEATDTFILSGEGESEEVFEPHFTYHGFRYVELTGLPGEPDLETITGQVIHTDAPVTGRLETSSELVNKIWLNTLWGQRGNFVSVPTDCPQRDERLGWMGDAQAFWRTACFNMDLLAFTHKWMRDVVEAQGEKGDFSDVSPRIIATNTGAPAWGDAGVIVPYAAWRQYGDPRIIEENWDAMARWIKYLHDSNPDLLWKKNRGNDYGDWVPANSETPKDLIATAYWAWDCQLMAEMGKAIGRTEEAKKYRELYEGIRAAFQKEFVKPDGTVGNGSQTCYVLALHMNLLPEDGKKKAVELLVKDIMETRKGFLSTGFLGTTYLMPVLSENGRNDVAFRLLLNDEYPSWGYMVRKGATTIWERWNGDTGDPAMNSYNHFCYGAVSEWMYRYMAGIDTAPETPGFKRSVIRPQMDERISRVRAEYDSLYGTIVSAWERKPDGSLEMEIRIPANTSALVYVPARDKAQVTEGGRPAEEAGLRFVRTDGDSVIFDVPAGIYHIKSPGSADVPSAISPGAPAAL